MESTLGDDKRANAVLTPQYSGGSTVTETEDHWVIAASSVSTFRRVPAGWAASWSPRRLREAEDRGEGEGTADAVLTAIALYRAAVFPIVAGSVGTEEQQACRAVAHRLSAHDTLPLKVRLSAAEALEVIDDGQSAEAAQAALMTLTMTVHDHRPRSR
ncbi:hypothetical protein ACWHLZ_34455 [Streptomyces chartreusis]